MTKAVRVLTVALALLGLVWAIAPRSAPPLYDGLGFPDEPYRFVHAPAGTRVTPPPTAAVGEVGVYGAQSYSLDVSSQEQAAQVSITLPSEAIRLHGATSTLVLRAAPQAMLTPPHGRYLWSNVYKISLTPEPAFVNRKATLTLRAATAQQPRPSIARYDGGHWTLLDTRAVGRDIYAAQMPGVGRYAVVGEVPLDLTLLGARKHQSGGGTWIGLAVGLGVIAVTVTLVLLGRRRRIAAGGRSAAPSSPRRGGAGAAPTKRSARPSPPKPTRRPGRG